MYFSGFFWYFLARRRASLTAIISAALLRLLLTSKAPKFFAARQDISFCVNSKKWFAGREGVEGQGGEDGGEVSDGACTRRYQMVPLPSSQKTANILPPFKKVANILPLFLHQDAVGKQGIGHAKRRGGR